MFTVEQIAEMFEMHSRTIRRYIREGKLKASKVGGEWRISEEDLSMFMGRKVQNLHEKSKSSIDEYVDSGNSEIDGIYRVCSIIDCYIDGSKAALISQELIKLMNVEDEERGKAKFQYFYLQEEQKSRFIIWGKPAFVGKMLISIDDLSKTP